MVRPAWVTAKLSYIWSIRERKRKAMTYILDLLTQLADGLAKQFGPDCEIVIHDLKRHDLEHSIVHINNGHVTNRREGDGPSKVILDTLSRDPAALKDHLGCLTRTGNGKILKSSTFYIRSKEGDAVDYLLSINYDITGLITVDRSIKALIDTEPQTEGKQQPEPVVRNVNDLLDMLIEQSVDMIGKPAALMNKEEKVTAIQFLNDAGAFLITKSGDKVSKYFGISKFTLYSYIDINSRKSEDKG